MTTINKPTRLLSIDAFRAVTLLLMIFVNDFGTLREIPEWLGHAREEDDAMGFSDVIFPAFLFIVGLSMWGILGLIGWSYLPNLSYFRC